MRRTRRRAALWVALCGSLLATAVVVPLLVTADSEQASFTATLYSDVIRFEADGVASLRVTIYDLSENELWNSALVMGDFVDWDRMNERGERLANGYYMYLAQGWDAAETLVLNKTGKVVLLPGDQVELKAAPVVGAVVGRGDDPVISTMAQTINDDLFVKGNIALSDTGNNWVRLIEGGLQQGQVIYYSALNYFGFQAMQGNSFRFYTEDAGGTLQERMRIEAGNSPKIYLGKTFSASDRTMTLDTGNQRVGIGTTSPGSPLTVTGIIESTSGGFKFPDATVQVTAATGGANSWSITGNAGTTPGTHFLGTTDNQALELHVNGQRALRIEPSAGSTNLIGGYAGNSAAVTGTYASTIAGGGALGFANVVYDRFCTIGGGIGNTAGSNDGSSSTQQGTTVGGGTNNTASDLEATVGGGYANTASGNQATVPGGILNTASGNYSFAAGHRAKSNHDGSFVWADSTGVDFASTGVDQFLVRAAGGVGINTANPTSMLTVAGLIESTSGGVKFPDGSTQTTAAGAGAFWSITGNAGTAPGTHFLGTTDNQALELHVNGQRALRIEPNAVSRNLIGGYAGNSAMAGTLGATISGGGRVGDANVVFDRFGAIGGGVGNTAGSDDGDAGTDIYATVGGGINNTASGLDATVPGGLSNTASGDYSFAAGRRAKANHAGSFVWADSTNADFASTAINQFSVRAVGGARFVSAIDGSGVPTAGVTLAAGGGSWSAISDRNLKENITAVDAEEILDRLSLIPITEWNMLAQDPSIRHVGPMAQDFYAAFGLGEDERYINSSDADGIALLSIQALYELLLEKDDQIEELEASNESLQAQMDDVLERLAALEQEVRN